MLGLLVSMQIAELRGPVRTAGALERLLPRVGALVVDAVVAVGEDAPAELARSVNVTSAFCVELRQTIRWNLAKTFAL